MPSLQQLRYLVALSDTLSFSRAATACHVTQPTLSMQLKELETRLGATLVERTRSRVILTPAGTEIAQRARRILADIEDIRDIATGCGAAGTPEFLRMGVVQTVGAYVLSLAMSAVREAFPNLRIQLREDRAENLPQKLVDGTHDALLLPEPIDHPDFASALLLREPLHLVLPTEHPLAVQERIHPKELRGEKILVMERGQKLHDEIGALCEAHGAIPVQDYAGTTLDTLRLMVTTGMGLSLLPALYVETDVMREKLIVSRPLSSGAPTRNLTIAWRRSSPRRQTYSDLAVTLRRALSPWQ